MARCEEEVIIACGLYLLSEEGKQVKRKYWNLMRFERKKSKENLTLCFEF
jgi:hypothetical protein